MAGDPRFPPDAAAARALQQRLAAQVRLAPLTGPVSRVAGVDAAFLADRVVAAVSVHAYPGLEPVAEAVATAPLELPYIPGLLSFREGPAILAALDRLEESPDLLLFDGQGIAHPRRLGIAAHIGVLLDRPAIGVAKSRLAGEADLAALGPAKGERVPLTLDGAVIGAVLRSRQRVRPLYVSPGHRVSVDDAVTWTLACCTRYRLPEPTRLADKAAARAKQRLRADEG
ncbi:MAG TPA: deoxyribonuclease V [Gammaproteobacteria bacterium]|nr:deoxyribonuclease V [Gammaproteobacteria bacterium]